MATTFAWASLLLSVLLVLAYEVAAHRARRRDPAHQARFINARVRADWAAAMSRQSGFEIVAVQALRNSLLSATAAASTAALALMGALTLGGASIASGLRHPFDTGAPALPIVLGTLVVLLLLASYVSASMSIRYYGNASFVLSMPAGSPERLRLDPVGADYVARAGSLYSWCLRLFLMAVPAVAGIVHAYALLPSTVVLLLALRFFDQPTEVELA
jgi:hypothetical protein